MELIDALEAALRESGEPLITEYELYRLGHSLFSSMAWQGTPLSTRMTGWDRQRFNAMASRLTRRKILAYDPDLSTKAWRVLSSPRSTSAEEVACIADPFCYVAFLSAMQRYSLTDRSPAALHLVTPSRTLWAERRHAQETADFPQRRSDHPPLIRIHPPGDLRGRPVKFHESKHAETPLQLSGERTRISTLGRTFADMVEEPALCGGMHHVLDVWSEHAETWLEEIVEAVDHTPVRLAKMRAGYILTERLALAHPKIERWAALAQRGGSQRLDPDKPYEPIYSERWMISINV